VLQNFFCFAFNNPFPINIKLNLQKLKIHFLLNISYFFLLILQKCGFNQFLKGKEKLEKRVIKLLYI
jgi:hypothetical protein